MPVIIYASYNRKIDDLRTLFASTRNGAIYNCYPMAIWTFKRPPDGNVVTLPKPPTDAHAEVSVEAKGISCILSQCMFQICRPD